MSEFPGLGTTDDEEEDEDEATQFMIEESLLDNHKHRETRHSRRPELEPSVVSQIFAAIKKGDETRLSDLVESGRFGFSDTDCRGWTPLHQAAAQTNQTLLEITFRASSPDGIRRRTAQGQTPLHLAVEAGLLENASFLLQHGADPDGLDQNQIQNQNQNQDQDQNHNQEPEQDSPICLAIRSDRSDLVDLLLRGGSRVNRGGLYGRRPLHEASRLGRTGLVDLLLEAGAEPDPRTHYGLTPMALAAQGGHLEVLKTLLASGADVFSQAQDEASILYEASSCGDPAVISLLLESGADANVAKLTGHLPLHRVAHRGHLEALKLLLPVTSRRDVNDSGMSPLHSAAAGGHTHCIKALLDWGYDPNFMLHPWVRRCYDDERKSALFFAVSNNDIASATALLEGGAMANQDPVKCLQVALRLGNHTLIDLLLRFGANVNYFCRINTTHFPSALQYALKDQVVLRMLCNYGYDVERCFDCHYGNKPHIPDDYEGWSNTVIKDTTFCEVISVSWLQSQAGPVVRVLLDYVDHVTLCCKLKEVLMEKEEWEEITLILGTPRSLQHLCRLRIRSRLGRLRLRSPVFMSFLPLPPRLKDFLLYREYDLLQRNTH